MRRTPKGIYLTERLWIGREPGRKTWFWRGYSWRSVCLLGLRADIRWRE